ncbi:alpha/beta-hydrolase [Hypoxylon crocopeplum]|nr:alpha/beta-hydrolase [Hypoxylon crocopeplum]
MASNFITTTPDGVRLRYWQDGPTSGPNVVFLPGWVQTAAQFKKQVEHFKTHYRVTTYDHRGHGDSDKPSFGYRVARLAADLECLLVQLDLRDVTLVGHSMGSSVIWAHWDLFAHDRLRKLVFVDQAPALTADPAWSPEQVAEAGAVFSAAQRFDVAAALRGPQWKEAWTGLSKGFFSPDVDPKDFEWALEQQMKAPPEVAAALMLDHAAQDWRDVIPRINVPTLVVGAKGSMVAVQGMEWITKQIPGARLEIFEKEEGGSHFMFWENPEKFNRILEEFLKA